MGHERRYTRDAVHHLLEGAGFETEQIRLVNPIGAIGWFIAGRLMRRPKLPASPLRAYDRIVPLLRGLDRFELPIGLSVWAVARRGTR
jgi:hypothetical protein